MAVNIKGIGSRGWLAPGALSIRPAVREGKKRICGGGCYSLLAILPVRHPAFEGVSKRKEKGVKSFVVKEKGVKSFVVS